jgi:hypothetical protein
VVCKLRLLFLLLILTVVGTNLVGCNASRIDHPGESHTIVMAEINTMPQAVQMAPQSVRDAYRLASANPHLLRQIPCYCGCAAMGHASNYACFWQENGQLDSHALDCGICVDIAQDVHRGMEQERTLAEIRSQVDGDYSRFGPGTDTPPLTIGTEGQ